MVYVTSNLGGWFLKYKELMELINFSKDDTLYVIGNVIGDHHQNAELLKELMSLPNVHVIRGPNEDMLIDYAYTLSTRSANLWMMCVYKELIEKCTPDELEAIIVFLQRLPVSCNFKEGEYEFTLVPCGTDPRSPEAMFSLMAAPNVALLSGAYVMCNKEMIFAPGRCGFASTAPSVIGGPTLRIECLDVTNFEKHMV